MMRQNWAKADNQQLAVIDIGSNSIRLVVFEALSRSPLTLINEKAMCGLGKGMASEGRLNPEGVASAMAALQRYRLLLDGLGVERVKVVATAAVRDALDGAEFLAAVTQQTGFTVEILSGDSEARYSAIGLLSGFPDADGLMGDLGGGSLELVKLEQGQITAQTSLPLGPFRMNGSQHDFSMAFAAVPWADSARGKSFYAVGGAWRALAKLHLDQTDTALHIIDHYRLGRAVALDFLDQLARVPVSELEKIPSINKKRAATLPHAALLLATALRHSRAQEVVFSAFGLREGILYEMLSPEARAEDPLLAACRELAEKNGRVINLPLLQQWLAPIVPDGLDKKDARLLLAAIWLSDMAWFEHPDYRAEQGFLRVLRMVAAGVDHRERAMLATIIFARYGGRLEQGIVKKIRRQLTDFEINLAFRYGAGLRLAYELSASAWDLLPAIILAKHKNQLELTLPQQRAILLTDAVRRRFENLCRLCLLDGVISSPAGKEKII